MFEYFNPHPRKLEITLPFGNSVIVEREGYAPTPEMEAKGITAEVLKDFVSKNLLHEVPPEKRDMFLRSREAIPVQGDTGAPSISAVEAKDVSGKTPGEGKKEEPKMSADDLMRQIRSQIEKTDKFDKPTKNLEESLQAIADATCSSIKIKKPSKD